mgnify:CR=1 FL=1
MTADTQPATRVHLLIAAAVLVLAVGSIYIRAWDHSFVSYDDPEYITENPHVSGGLSVENIRWAFTAFHSGNWHPLTWITLMTDVSLWGTDTAGPMVLTNAAIHALSSVLLLAWLARFTGRTWLSVAVAAVFALHPLRVESVAWATERKDVLTTFWWIASMWCYALYARRGSWRWYAMLLVSVVLGVMSKPMIVTLPCALLLLDVWPLRRTGDRRRWLRLIVEKLPLLAIVGLGAVLTLKAQTAGEAVRSATQIALSVRLENALVAYVQYLRMTAWPSGLCMNYPHPALFADPHYPWWQWLGAAFVLIAITAALAWLAWRRDLLPPLIGWLWYLGTLVPIIGIVSVGQVAWADRHTYIPSIGLLIAVVWLCAAFVRRLPPARSIVIAVAALYLGICIGLSWRQVGYWRDSVAMWRRVVQVNDRNWWAHGNLAGHYAADGRWAPAVRHNRRAYEIRPSQDMANILAESLVQQGVELGKAGDLDAAIANLERALELNPAHPTARANLAYAKQLRQGR